MIKRKKKYEATKKNIHKQELKTKGHLKIFIGD